jgi:hypothetical protein
MSPEKINNQDIEKVKPLLVDKEMISQTNNEPIETMKTMTSKKLYLWSKHFYG